MKRTMSGLLALVMLFMLAVSFAEQAEGAEALPEAFDLRSVDTDGDGAGDRCYVPPVRQQNPFGSCWGFAATAASEISILGSVLEWDPDAWKTIDLSEKQMVYFSHVPRADWRHGSAHWITARLWKTSKQGSPGRRNSRRLLENETIVRDPSTSPGQ